MKTKKDLVATWQALFHRMFNGLKPAAQEPREQIKAFDQAIQSKYGVAVEHSCVGERHSGAVSTF